MEESLVVCLQGGNSGRCEGDALAGGQWPSLSFSLVLAVRGAGCGGQVSPGALGGPFSSQNPGTHCHWGDVGGYTLTLTVVQTANLSSLQFVCCPTFCGSVVPSLLMFVERSIFIFPVQQPLYLLYHFI